MSEPRHDRTDDELASLLRATFATESRQRVPDARPVPPFPTGVRRAAVHPTRRRWIGFSLVAAALVAVVAGATFFATQVFDSERKPVPPGTTAPPPPTVSPTAPTTASGPTGTPTTSTAPAAAIRKVTVLGVTLTVPATWIVADAGDAASGRAACLSTDRTRKDTGTNADNCELTVNVLGVQSSVDVDRPSVIGESGICGSSPQVPQQTVTVDQVTVDGQTAEHRVFTASCVPVWVEQWTVPTAPLVVFTREPTTDDPAGEAQAAAAVVSAVLPGPRSSVWLGDHGLLTGFSGSTLTLDRVTYRYGNSTINNNPATYDYPVASGADIEYTGSASPTRVDLTLDQLRALGNGQPVPGVPPLDSLAVTVWTDGEQATIVLLADR